MNVNALMIGLKRCLRLGRVRGGWRCAAAVGLDLFSLVAFRFFKRTGAKALVRHRLCNEHPFVARFCLYGALERGETVSSHTIRFVFIDVRSTSGLCETRASKALMRIWAPLLLGVAFKLSCQTLIDWHRNRKCSYFLLSGKAFFFFVKDVNKYVSYYMIQI